MKQWMLVSVSALTMLTGCTVIRELPQMPQEVTEKKQVAEYEHGRKLLEAFVKNDGRKFVSLLPPQLIKQFDEKAFQTTRKTIVESMGEPVSFRYVTQLEMASVTPFIWSVRFERIGSRDKTKVFHSEILFRAVVGTLNGKPIILGFQFL